jgi:hypothetical protein
MARKKALNPLDLAPLNLPHPLSDAGSRDLLSALIYADDLDAARELAEVMVDHHSQPCWTTAAAWDDRQLRLCTWLGLRSALTDLVHARDLRRRQRALDRSDALRRRGR